VCRIATEGDYDPGHVAWAIDFEHGGRGYRWEGTTGTAKSAGPLAGSLPSGGGEAGTVFSRERVTLEGTTCLVERDESRIAFGGAALPVDMAASALFSLGDHDDIAPVRHAFNSVLPSAATATHPLGLVPGHAESIQASIDDLRAVSTGKDAFQSFREGWAQAGLSALAHGILMVAYYIQEVFPEQFREVERLFTGMFTSVQAVKVLFPRNVDDPSQLLQLSLQEAGNARWIPQSEISSGMLRTLVHLFELHVAPAGSVVLIDELENGLGANCLPGLTRFMLSRMPDLQLILTSHHPCVINDVPVDAWKVVTRKAGRVCVKGARDIAAVQSTSHHEAFTRLLAHHELAAVVA
jgi:hypothetical protein